MKTIEQIKNSEKSTKESIMPTLPIIIGDSEKQVAFAMKIRNEKTTELINRILNYEADVKKITDASVNIFYKRFVKNTNKLNELAAITKAADIINFDIN